MPFITTTEPEPHFARRKRLLKAHPEIRTLFGYDPWPNLWIVLCIVVQFGIAALLQFAVMPGWARAIAVIVAAYAVGAFIAHYGGVIFHEASHNLVAPTETLNRLAAIFANFVNVVPCAMTFRRHHGPHHKHIGYRAVDNDLPGDLERIHFGHSPLRKLFWLCTYTFWAVFFRGFWRKPDRWEVFGVAVQLTVNALAIYYIGWVGFAYLAISTWLSSGPHPVAGHFIHEHYIWHAGQETYSYYGILNRVTANLGYHNEHHDFVSVPGSRLPELHAMLKDEYAPLYADNSWAKVMWRFVFDPSITHDSRFYRGLTPSEGASRSRPDAARSSPAAPLAPAGQRAPA